MIDIMNLDFEDEFIKNFTVYGGVVVECYCGRTHITAQTLENGDDEDRDELKRFELLAEIDSMYVIDHTADNLEVLDIGGKQFVNECECEGWKPYMNFIVSQRKEIAPFLLEVHDKFKQAVENEKIIGILRDAK